MWPSLSIFYLTKTNKMRELILSLMAWSLPFLLIAQSNTSTQSMVTKEGPGATDGKGVHWITGLSWEQIKQKAKRENKHIFIDAFTTWCGPCKLMDKDVYSNDTVGHFFNEHFISVKVQMNKTEGDGQSVIDWYSDSKRIGDEYAITSYPSLIFLSPESTPLYMIEGFRSVNEFVDTAKLVLTKGTAYNDPYKDYRKLASEYKQGIKYFDRMPYMIRTARKLNDNDFARELFKDHLNYVSGLNETERYTQDNILLWSSFVLKMDSKALQFFLKDHDKIDQVMRQKGFSIMAVNKTIQGRIVDSFFRMQKGETTTITGKIIPNSEIMFIWLPERQDGKIKPDYMEADWNKLKIMIRNQFSKDYTKRNVFDAKISWYWKHQNMEGVAKTYFSQLAKYPPEDLVSEYEMINEICWQTFLYSNNKKLLQKALEWMNKTIQHGDKQGSHLDTYANLLYKLGRTEEAIRWEQKVVNDQAKLLRQNVPNQFKPVVEKMKKGEPTYLELGAIWLNKNNLITNK
jgi:thioredoxin-related protein